MRAGTTGAHRADARPGGQGGGLACQQRGRGGAGARQRAALANPRRQWRAAVGFAGRGSGGSRPPPLADAPDAPTPDPQHACPSPLHPAAQPGRAPRGVGPGRPPASPALDAETLPDRFFSSPTWLFFSVPWICFLPSFPRSSCSPCVRFVPLFVPFPALVPSFTFCAWRSLRWDMSGLTPSDPFGWRRPSCPEL
eukprot:365869-Chlamydomonas_euryale.AAC.7